MWTAGKPAAIPANHMHSRYSFTRANAGGDTLKTARKRFAFTTDQVKQLSRLGIAQADLPKLMLACRTAQTQGWFDEGAKRPTRKQQLDAVNDVAGLSKKLSNRLKHLPGAINPDLYGLGVNVTEQIAALEGLRAACAFLLPAMRAYKGGPIAPTIPIALIWRAMPSKINLSSGATSTFRQIVGICYEALGAPVPDPERAIKAFVKAEKQRLRDARATPLK